MNKIPTYSPPPLAPLLLLLLPLLPLPLLPLLLLFSTPGYLYWAVTFIPMPMPKTVCITKLYSKIVRKFV